MSVPQEVREKHVHAVYKDKDAALQDLSTFDAVTNTEEIKPNDASSLTLHIEKATNQLMFWKREDRQQ